MIKFSNMYYRKDIGYKEKKYMKYSKHITYKQSGVDVEAGNEFIKLIKPIVKSTRLLGADAEIGGFGGIFDMKCLNYKDPLIVSSTDGVGTKLKLSIMLNKYDTIGNKN